MKRRCRIACLIPSQQRHCLWCKEKWDKEASLPLLNWMSLDFPKTNGAHYSWGRILDTIIPGEESLAMLSFDCDTHREERILDCAAVWRSDTVLWEHIFCSAFQICFITASFSMKPQPSGCPQHLWDGNMLLSSTEVTIKNHAIESCWLF